MNRIKSIMLVEDITTTLYALKFFSIFVSGNGKKIQSDTKSDETHSNDVTL